MLAARGSALMRCRVRKFSRTNCSPRQYATVEAARRYSSLFAFALREASARFGRALLKSCYTSEPARSGARARRENRGHTPSARQNDQLARLRKILNALSQSLSIVGCQGCFFLFNFRERFKG